MKVLVVGNGGREHALVRKISLSPVDEIFCAPGNAGTSSLAKNLDIQTDDIPRLKRFALEKQIDLTIVGPEKPLINGIVDEFEAVGLKIYGPTKNAAILEGSKVFTKELLWANQIPTAKFRVFSDIKRAKKYIDKHGLPIVIKVDGLAAGKGVRVCHSEEDACLFLAEIEAGKFGATGEFIVEECLKGEEASYIVLVDKNGNILPLATSRDYKARDDNDEGPNTGGMGAYSPAPAVNRKIEEFIIKKIIKPTINAMKRIGRPFVGILYAGLMIDESGIPNVLEFNVRLGDPEAQPILARMKSDLVPIILMALEGNLDITHIEWDKRPALCVVMASNGYPDSYIKGFPISGISEAEKLGATVLHAGTIKDEKGNIFTDGGRVVGITNLGNSLSLKEAQQKTYKAVEKISWLGSFYRRDIGE